MTNGASLDDWLTAHRRAALIVLDSAAWAVSLLFFSLMRFMDVTASFPWSRLVAGVGMAITLQFFFGTLLVIHEPRNPIGSKEDATNVAKAVVATTLILQLFSFFFVGGRLLPLSVPIAAGAATLALTVGSRLLWRTMHESTLQPHTARRALVFGAGNAGGQLVGQMVADPNSPFRPVGLLDDDPAKRRLRIRGVEVLGTRADLACAAEKSSAEVLIIAIPSARSGLFRDVSDEARTLGLEVKVLPTLDDIFNGQVGLRDIRDIDITDLLGRDPVDTDVAAAAGYVTGRRVLVTGAGGSIGSELCRQLAQYKPAALFMLDRDETALQGVQMSLTGRGLLDSEDVVLCDIRDAEALGEVFAHTRPQVVFHAAALKHLPMLEQYPEEAWKTNVLGTANVLEAAREADVEVFVNISTDKAANPCSVLGYSKRIAERLTAAVAEETPGKFVSVRFGNVIGSRGSVLPAFAEQIAKGGPVTVTHRDATRFFMMIPEACELVIQAAAVGLDGEALVLEMGAPVRILDVAEQMIAISGRDDIAIEITGLRDGEKLHEELFGAAEGTRTTSHPLIEAVPVPPLGIGDVRASAVCWGEAVAEQGAA